MGFSFNFFGKQEVRRSNYRPRFYNPEEEERRQKFGDHSQEKKEYVPGQLVRGSLRDGNFKDTKDVTRNQKYLGMLAIILLFAVIYSMFKYFPHLIEVLDQRSDWGGVVVNKVDAVPFADASIVFLQDGKIIAKGVSDADGKFMLRSLPHGEYDVIIKTTGNPDVTMAVTIDRDEKNLILEGEMMGDSIWVISPKERVTDAYEVVAIK